jgi:hypothetical protein
MKIVEHPDLSRRVFGLSAAEHIEQSAGTESDKSSEVQEKLTAIGRALAGVGNTAFQPIDEWYIKRTVPQGVGEWFGYKLSTAIKGLVNVPEVRLTTSQPLNAHDWFSKRVNGGWCNSKRVRRSLPIYYVNKESRAPFFDRQEEVLHFTTKTCPVARDYYADFPAELELDKGVQEIVKYNSPQRLLQYAFRAFLYATYPHSSNALVEATGDNRRLWLIDHEKLVLSEGAEDIDALHEIIQHYGPGLNACRQISQITEADIMKSLAGISYQFWQQDCAFNNEEDAGEYYKQRLRAWKKFFAYQDRKE